MRAVDLDRAAREWLPWLATFVLAALRLAPATLLLPVFGGRSVPTQSRVAILLVLGVAVSPALHAPAALDLTAAAIAWGAVRELSIGLPIALVLATPFFALEHAGHLLDAARGANVAEVIAPDSGARSSPLAEVLRGTYAVVFLAAGGLRATLQVVAESFDAWPIAGARSRALPSAAWLDVSARWTSHALGSSLTLVAAALLAMLAVELMLAVTTRLAPPIAQSNAAIPVRALVPLALLALTVGVWTGAAGELARHAIEAARTLARS